MSDVPVGKPAQTGRVCVFCGSGVGANSKHLAEAKLLGKQMAGRGWDLVYGGTSIGLMGAMADAALMAGGEVIGVLPRALQDRNCSSRPDESAPCSKHARTQGADGVFIGRFHRAARRLRDA
ncbi:MAG: yvdD [Bryobacterales bacterium]|nr:yvdD [Bryobacterales bacterium]